MNQSEAVPLPTVSSFVGVVAALFLGIAIFVAQLRLAGMFLQRDKDKKTITMTKTRLMR